MKKQQFIIDADDADQKRRTQVIIGMLHGRVRVELTPYRPRRSDRQLAYYWPCVVVPFAEWQRDENGEKYDEDDAHNTLKAEFLTIDKVNKETGERYGHRVRSTGELSTTEFEAYVEECRNHIAKYCGIVIPDPDPKWRDNTAERRTASTAA